MDENEFGTWAIVELMGHVRLGGYVTEEERFGQKMGRIDMPFGDGQVTQYFGGSSVYRMTPCTEEAATAVAQARQPVIIHRFELPKPRDQEEYYLDDSGSMDMDDDFGV